MSHFLPKDPLWLEKVQQSFAKQGIMQHLGATLVAVRPGHCEIALPYRPELSQQMGYFHAGVTSTVLDSAAGYAGFSLMPANTEVLSVEFKINMLAPADGHKLIAVGRVVKAGKNLVIAVAEGYVMKQGAGDAASERRTHCALMQQTLMTMHPKEK